jgi:mRNA interferase MazF
MSESYTKDFKAWSKKKVIIDRRNLPEDFFFLEGEIWWATLGVNIGHEIDGKNEMYERPVLVLKKISESMLWVLPITTKIHPGLEYSHFMEYRGRPQMILLFQLRMISSKRLLRLVSRIREDRFSVIKVKVESMITSIKTIPSD